MKFTITLGLTALGLLGLQARADDRKDAEADAAKLVGTYRIESGERDGRKIDDGHLKDVTVTIGANAIATLDKDKKEVYAATYKLDAGKKPWRISMTATIAPADGKGTKAEGLIAKDGDTVKLIYALPGGKAPTEFKTGEKQQMFILKKAEKK